jgi:hypothetical protein
LDPTSFAVGDNKMTLIKQHLHRYSQGQFTLVIKNLRTAGFETMGAV